MEPFVIQCTTCRARLKVSDPALVGDIVGCPKCESFVQVTPPAGWQPPLPGAAAAIAVTSAGAAATNSASGTIPLEAAQKFGAAVAKQPAASQPTAKQSAATRSTASQETVKQPRAAAAAPLAPPPLPAGAPAATGSSALAKTTAAKTTAPRAAVGTSSLATGSSSLPVGTSSLIVPEPAAEPSALGRLLETAQEHYWIATGSLASLAAIVTIAWLALASKTEVAPPADSPAAEVALGSDREPNSPAANEKNTGLDSADGQKQNSDSGAARAEAEQQSSAADKGDSSASANAAANVAKTVTNDREPKPTADGSAEDSSSAGSFVARKTDPLDPIARALATEPEPLSSTNPGAAPVDRPAPGPAVPSDDIASSAVRTSVAGRKDDPAESESSTRAKQAKLVAHLQDKIPPTEFRDIPLGQFLTFLSELSTVPIAMDAESLQKADKSAKTKITVKLAGGTVEEALRAALAKPGLSFHVEPKRILVTAGTATKQ